MEDRRMANSYEKVLNSAVDPLTLTVQIVGKGMETRIIFDAKGSYRVEHTAPAA